MSDYAGTIYLLKNRASGRLYVGQTSRPLAERLREHARKSVGSKQAISKAIQSYGMSGFQVITLAMCASRKELHLAECFWIKKLNSMVPNGYNLRPAGLVEKFTQEHRQKISAALKGQPKPWLLGKKQSAETSAKKSAALKGRSHMGQGKGVPHLAMRGRERSPEHCAKLSAAMKARPMPWLEGNTHKADWLKTHESYKPDAEIRAKMSAALKGRKNTWMVGNTIKAEWLKTHEPYRPTPEIRAKMSVSIRAAKAKSRADKEDAGG